MTDPLLAIEPLTREAFARFGDVVETGAVAPKVINQGFARRFDGLATIDVATGGGEVNVSLFAADQRATPIRLRLMERHPLGSQLFMPLQDRPWFVVVCEEPRDPTSYRAFRAGGTQGVNYARNVWHHPLLVLDPSSRFLVVDRAGPGTNLEEVELDRSHRLALAD